MDAENIRMAGNANYLSESDSGDSDVVCDELLLVEAFVGFPVTAPPSCLASVAALCGGVPRFAGVSTPLLAGAAVFPEASCTVVSVFVGVDTVWLPPRPGADTSVASVVGVDALRATTSVPALLVGFASSCCPCGVGCSGDSSCVGGPAELFRVVAGDGDDASAVAGSGAVVGAGSGVGSPGRPEKLPARAAGNCCAV